MAGIIAAATNNRRGIAGIGYAGVKVMPVTVLDANGLGQDSDIIEGIVWAVDHGADVINLSFSNPGYSTALQAAIDYAWDHDVVVVAATGNDGSGIPTYPAGDHGVIGVSDTDRSDRLDVSSNYGADTFLRRSGHRDPDAAGGRRHDHDHRHVRLVGRSRSRSRPAAGDRSRRPPTASSSAVWHGPPRPWAPAPRPATGVSTSAVPSPIGGPCRSTPVGAAPFGNGGPFVGPYVIAAATVSATSTLNGSVGSISVAPGASITLVMTVTTTGAGAAAAWDSSRWAFGTVAPAAAAMTCVDHPNHAGPGTFSETMTITAPAAAGTYNLYLYAYNGDACASGQSALFTRANALDNVVPTVTINQAAAQLDPTNGATINFTVVFSETVVGFTTGDVTLSGTAGATTGTVTGGPTTYNVAVTGMTGSGTVIATIGAGVAADAAGNPNDPSTSTDNTVTRDVTPPTVTIDQAVGQADPTATTPILFTVVFSEPVTGFITGDVAVAGTSGGAKTGTVSGGPTVYTVTVTGMTTSGTVVATIAANKANDLAGNANTASTSTDNTVTWDVTGPTVTINQAVGQLDPTNTSPILFTVVFNEPAVGFATGDVTFTGTAGGPLTGTVTGGPTTYTVAVSGMTTPGTVIATHRRRRGDRRPRQREQRLDLGRQDGHLGRDPADRHHQPGRRPGSTRPTARPSTSRSSSARPVVGFTTGDVTLSGTAGATTGTVTGGPTTYNVAVTGMTGSGTVIATIGAGVAADAAGNPNDPSTSTDNTVTRDVTPPTVTIDQAVGQADPTATTPILFTVVFSEPVTGFITGDVAVAGTSGGAKTGTGQRRTDRLHGHRHRHDHVGHGRRDDRRQQGQRPRRQRQHRVHLDRQHGHLGRDRADRHHQPGGRPARPDEHEPDPLHGRLQRTRHRLRHRRRHVHRDGRRSIDRHGDGRTHDVHRGGQRDDDTGHGDREHRRRRGDRRRSATRTAPRPRSTRRSPGTRPRRPSPSTRPPPSSTRPTARPSTSRSSSARRSSASRPAT